MQWSNQARTPKLLQPESSRASKPQVQSLCAPTTEARAPRACVQQKRSPRSAKRSSIHSPPQEKAQCRKRESLEDPVQPKVNKDIVKKKKRLGD